MNSIMQNKKECFICQSQINLEEHHIFFGNANRRLSEQDGLKVWLCVEHHRGTNGVHGKNGNELDHRLKQIAEKKWIDTYNKSINDFIKKFGRNYL